MTWTVESGARDQLVTADRTHRFGGEVPPLSDRDRLLLAFAKLAGYGIAARPASPEDGTTIVERVRRHHPGALGSYVFWRESDDGAFDAHGKLVAPLTLYCSGEEARIAVRAACREADVLTGTAHHGNALLAQPHAGRP